MSSGLKLEVDIDDVDMYHHSVFFANSPGFGAISRNVNALFNALFNVYFNGAYLPIRRMV